MYKYEIITKAIDMYVKQHGYVIKTKKEIEEITGCDFLLTDYCYNNFNKGISNVFPRDCVLEKKNSDEYKLLGSEYSYTGFVYHTPDGDNKKKYIYGEWKNGKFKKLSDIANDMERDIDKAPLKGEEKAQLVKARINQNIFRDNLLVKYECCCLCGIENKEMLIASHIKPWAKADPEEKLDYSNGLLLCPNHDKLFDKGLISFDNDGKILISEKLSERDRKLLNVEMDMSIAMSKETKRFMNYHRENVFVK